MFKKFIAYCVTLTMLSPLFSQAVMAQDAGGGGGDDLLEQSMQDAYTVAALGGVGAILGLSTLSFVDEPKDHLKNIVVGGAIGVIVGVAVVAWTQASKSRDSYQNISMNAKEFSTASRLSWHKVNHNRLNHVQTPSQFANFNFTF